MRDDDPVVTPLDEKKMETLNIPQLIEEISQFFTVYGSLMMKTSLIFVIIAASFLIKAEPDEPPFRDENQTPLP